MSSKSSGSSTQQDNEPLPGYVGNLTDLQEYRLKEAWLAMLISAGIVDKSVTVGVPFPESAEKPIKGSRFSFRGPTGLEKFTPAELVAELEKATSGVKGHDLINEFRQSCRMDNPDGMLLRFLRARKWDLKRSLEQFGHTIRWRAKEWDVDEMLERGEQYYIDVEPDETYIDQYKSEKVTVHGHDKQGRPIVFIHVAKHDPRAQSEKVMERFTLAIIESTRMCLSQDINTAAVVFDLGGFGLHNMDYAVVKFILSCFEQYYPESLGYLFIHRAPWVFASVWAIIKGWIDPVVASKISFTKNEKDLLKFIDSDQIPKEMGGTSPFEYKWIYPEKGESRYVLDAEGRAQGLKERNALYDQLDKLTLQWIKAPTREESDRINAERSKKYGEIYDQYWRLDPFIRARTIEDRNGTLGTFKPQLASGGISQPTL